MPFARQEDRRASQRRWAQANKERISKHAREWRSKNPEYGKKWREQNRDKIAAYRRKDRQGWYRKFSKIGISKPDAIFLQSKKTDCAFCGDSGDLQLDHIVPRSRGGSNALANLQWLCVKCNSSKGAMTPEEFFAHIRKVLMRATN